MVHLRGIEKGPVWDRNFTSPSPVVVGGVHSSSGKEHLHHISLWYISEVLRKVQSGTETLPLRPLCWWWEGYIHQEVKSTYITFLVVHLRGIEKGHVWDRKFTSPSPVVVGGVFTASGKVYLRHISLWYISEVLRKVQSWTETLPLPPLWWWEGYIHQVVKSTYITFLCGTSQRY